MNQTVTTVYGFKVTVERRGWPGRMWTYTIEQGWQYWTGGEYYTRQEAEEAANRKLQELRDGK